MYEFFSKMSEFLSEPFANVAHSTDIALMAALFLGFIGSVAPCQISANFGAITYFGNRMVQQKMSWLEVLLYFSGKILVFSLFGLLFWIFGRNITIESIPVFVFARKFVGPLMIFIGLFLAGWIKLRGSMGLRLSSSLHQFSEKIGGAAGALLMGVAFSLGFCPTMFILFFGTVMPLAFQSSIGLVLPPVFAVGTAMPFLLFLAIYIGFGLDRFTIKKAKKWGAFIQKVAGVLFIVLGTSDTLTYWML